MSVAIDRHSVTEAHSNFLVLLMQAQMHALRPRILCQRMCQVWSNIWHGNGIVIVQVAASRMCECSDELCKSGTRGLGEAGYL